MERRKYTKFLMIAIILGMSMQFVHAGNILGLFPHHGFSHFKIFYPVMRGLAERGHNVTIVTYIKSPEPHLHYEELLLGGKETVGIAPIDEFTPTRSFTVMMDEFFALHHEGQESCEIFYESGHVERILERHKRVPYDLVVMEFFNTDCYMAVPHLLNVPIVGVSSCSLMPWYYDRILLPDSPAYVQSEFIGFPEVLSWHQRLLNFAQSRANKLLYRYLTNYRDNEIIKKYLNIDVDVDEIAKKRTSLVFVNQHYSLLGNRPRTSQLIDIGGIHTIGQNKFEPLPEAIQRFLENVPSNQRVLFISWGSVLRMSTMEKVKLNAIIRVLKQLPLKVIWKWETDEKPVKSKQFLFVKWAPQLSLLCDPRVNLFWGHGGLLGITEVVHCGKPVMLTPIYGDQFLNANAVKTRQMGVIMPFDEINENNLKASLQELMHKNYTENAGKLSEIFRNRESTPLQTAMWWIEHLLQHGSIAGDLLHTKAVHLNWFVYYSLDSISLLLLGLFAIILVFYHVIKIGRSVRKRVEKIKKN